MNAFIYVCIQETHFITGDKIITSLAMYNSMKWPIPVIIKLSILIQKTIYDAL